MIASLHGEVGCMPQNDDTLLKEDSPSSATLRVDEELELAAELESVEETELHLDPRLESKSATPSTVEITETAAPVVPAPPGSDAEPSPPSATPFDPSAEYKREIDYTPTTLVSTSWTYFYVLTFLIIGIPLIILVWGLMQASHQLGMTR